MSTHLEERRVQWAEFERWHHADDFGKLFIQYPISNRLLRPWHDQTIVDRRSRNVVLPRKAQHGGYNHPAFSEHQVTIAPWHVGSELGAPLAKQRVKRERLFANHADRIFLAINRPTILPVSLRERLLEVRRPFGDQRAIAERSVDPEFDDGTIQGFRSDDVAVSVIHLYALAVSRIEDSEIRSADVDF